MSSAETLHGQSLLLDWGHNFYRVPARLAADEHLARARVCALLAQCRGALDAAEAAYRRENLPALSRAAPRHDPAAIETARAVERLAAKLGALAGRLQAQPAPPQADFARAAARDPSRLARLLACDAALAALAAALWHQLEGQRAERIGTLALSPALEEIGAHIAERGQILGSGA